VAELDERKALDRLGRSLRNLINGARPGAGLDDETEPEAAPPAPNEPAQLPAGTAEPPPA
jgi:hypothetical protein